MFNYAEYSDADLEKCRRIHSDGMRKLDTRIEELERSLDAARQARALRQREFDLIVEERGRRTREALPEEA